MLHRVGNQFGVELPLRTLFEAPTIRRLASLLDDASPTASAPAIVPMFRDEYPLSYLQEHLWLAHHMFPDSPSYNLSGIIHIAGDLQRGLLHRAFAQVVGRHSSLRTKYVWSPAGLVQRLLPTNTIPWELEDLSNLPAEELPGRARSLVEEIALKPFDLKKGPALRARLLAIGEGEHQLLLAVHHIACDNWSIRLLFTELCDQYQALSESRPQPEPLPFQYGDFALWQRDRASETRFRTDLAAYCALVAPPVPILQLAADFNGDRQTLAGGAVSFFLPAEAIAPLSGCCREAKATLFIGLLAVFKLLLARHSGNNDIVVGMPYVGRPDSSSERLIGCFVNTLVLRTTLDDRLSFPELLGRVRANFLQTLEFSDIPLGLLSEEITKWSDKGARNFLKAMFAFHEEFPKELRFGDAIGHFSEIDTDTENFDVSMICYESLDGVRCQLRYNSERFSERTALEWASRYRMLVTETARNPDMPIGVIPSLISQEARYYLDQTSGPSTLREKELCLHDLVNRQMSKYQSYVAVRCGSQTLSYEQLGRRAHRLASVLQTKSVGLEKVVGLYMGPSFDLVVGMLGVLEAGGAFLLLDPMLPVERLKQFTRDSNTMLVLAPPHLADLASVLEKPVTIICNDELPGAEQNCERVRPAPNNLAYIVYTSGSTGAPKGAMNEHGGLANVIQASIRTFGPRPGMRVLQHAALSFDNSIWEIFMALAAGAEIDVEESTSLFSGTQLAERLRKQRINFAVLTPSVLSTLPCGYYPDLTALLVGGEPCSGSLARLWGRGRRLWNTYGPAETSIHVTFHEHGQTSDDAPPIGRPTENLCVYVLDSNLQLVPPGVPGLLYIAGAGVGRGYVGRPDLTAASFLPNPFSPSGERMYASGDVARYRRDGRIEFIGRKDDQVKIRGNRVELGEIEWALRQHPRVNQSFVVVDGAGARQRLTAFVVPEDLQLLSAEDLRSHLKPVLPPYMMPSDFVFLDALPLTRSGKVDRSRLPLPNAASAAAPPSPASQLETTIAAIWASLLEVDSVSVDVNFFDVGGNSLLLAHLESRLYEQLGTKLSVANLFRHPTVRAQAELARKIGKTQTADVRAATSEAEVKGKAQAYAAQQLRRIHGSQGNK
jgi:amino acid adenylation domain-containing protein